MELVRLSSKNQRQVIRRSCAILERGGVVVHPTDTVYGLGCDPFRPSAVSKLLAIKGRSETKGLILLVESERQLRRIASVKSAERKFLARFWPGPVTFVLAARPDLPRLLTGGRKTIAVRWPKGQFIETFLEMYNRPLVSTSANISGQSAPRSVKPILEQFQGRPAKPDLVIDAGQLSTSQPSTLIKISRGRLRVLRQGAFHLPPDV